MQEDSLCKGWRYSVTLFSSYSPLSLRTFPVAAATVILSPIIALTHTWISVLTLVPKDVAGKAVPLR